MLQGQDRSTKCTAMWDSLAPAHLVSGVDQSHELLQRAVKRWARDARGRQQRRRLHGCTSEIDDLARASRKRL